jgi:hypothetical protein
MICPVCGGTTFMATTKGTLCKTCKTILDGGIFAEEPKK